MSRDYEKELKTLLRSGALVVEIASYEWQRVHGFVDYVAEDLGQSWYTWSRVTGIKKWTGKGFKDSDPDAKLLSQAIDFYLQAEDNLILILEDFHPYSDIANPENIRYIREMTRPHSYLKPKYKKNIILSAPMKYIPEELNKELPVIEIDLPSIDELKVIANSVVKELGDLCVTNKITTKLLELVCSD